MVENDIEYVKDLERKAEEYIKDLEVKYLKMEDECRVAKLRLDVLKSEIVKDLHGINAYDLSFYELNQLEKKYKEWK